MGIINNVNDTRIINLPKVENQQGNLTAVHNSQEIPFDIKRVYYLYDVPGGETRGGHAHKELQQFIISLSGSFDILLDDGKERKTVTLNRSHYGLYVPQFIWREIINFSTGGVCLVLASLPYNESEYIRDFDEFLKLKSEYKS
jgi:dTDP-4-dehydrorhamnose 3,5-epimerase-like enzyme